MASLFDQNNQAPSQPEQLSGGLSFQGIPMDRRPQRVPLGRGLYEIVKMGKRKTQTNTDQFYAVLKCLEHVEQPGNVDRVFEFTTLLSGLFVKNSLADVKKLVMFSYGAAVAKLDEKVVGQVLDTECLADDWARFSRDQTIQGKTFVGNKIRIFGSPGKTVDKDGNPKKDKRGNVVTAETAFPRYYFDPADAA